MSCTPDCVKPKPFSRLEHCKVCHESFDGTRPGDAHRVGDHGLTTGPDRRRCRTSDEMRAVGLWQDDRGAWHGRATKTGEQKRRTVPGKWSGPSQTESAAVAQ